MSKTRNLVLTERIPIRWGDMDALGHVNNTVYFRYMEQTRIRFFEHSGMFYGDNEGHGAVIVNASCTFRKALVYPGTVEVRMYLSEPGRSSVDSHYELICDGEVHADGAARIVWVNLATSRAVPLPQRVRDFIARTAPPGD